MATYSVSFHKSYTYWVEAKDEKEAVDLAYEDFNAAMRSPRADIYFDDVDVRLENEE